MTKFTPARVDAFRQHEHSAFADHVENQRVVIRELEAKLAAEEARTRNQAMTISKLAAEIRALKREKASDRLSGNRSR